MTALFDFFKKEEEEKAKKKPAVVVKKKKTKKAVVKKEEVLKPQTAVKKTNFESYNILSAPHITEKATNLTEHNQYIFKVFPHANKIEIRKAVENNYGVNVENVRIINIPRRKRRVGRNMGWKKGYRKAIVRIKKGQSIEIMPR